MEYRTHSSICYSRLPESEPEFRECEFCWFEFYNFIAMRRAKKINRSIRLGLYWTVFKSEVPYRSSFATSCILKRIRTDSLKVAVPPPIHTTSSNLQRVCFETGLVPALSLKWIRLTNRSCYCLVQCFFSLTRFAVCLLVSVSLNL